MSSKITKILVLFVAVLMTQASLSFNNSRLEFLLQKNKSEVSGPNCFNSVLYTLGILDGIRYTSDIEFKNALVAYCKEIPDGVAIQEGDVGLVLDSDKELLHGFIFLNSEKIFSKSGFYSFFPYELININNLLMFGAVGSCPECPNPILKFRCSKRSLSLDIENKIAQLEARFQKYAFDKRIDFYPNPHEMKYLKTLEAELNLIKTEFSKTEIQDTKLKVFINSSLESLDFNVKRWLAPDDDD